VERHGRYHSTWATLINWPRRAWDCPPNDPKFDEKLNDAMGLNLEPPEQAIVSCVDDAGQLRQRQARRGAPMAEAAQPFSPALHTNLVVLAPSRRALVSRSDRQKACAAEYPAAPDRITSIEEHLNAINADTKPYAWTVIAEANLVKVKRARAKLQQVVDQH
jgi:hypothetical protein